MFNQTIKQNIAYGKPDATMEEIEQVAKLSKLDDLIHNNLNMGYDTLVGERGKRTFC